MRVGINKTNRIGSKDTHRACEGSELTLTIHAHPANFGVSACQYHSGGCPPLEDIYRQIERRGASWHGSSHGPDQRTYQLLVAGEVKKIRPLGPGDWTVLMTPPWTPHASGARPLRLAVAIDDEDIDVGGDGLQPDEISLERRFPRLELVYADGRTRVAKFPYAK